MTWIFHLLFSIVLLFNVSACQSKTKLEKANDKLTKPLVSEPLTKPIHLNQDLDITNLTKIQSEEELKQFLVHTYRLPARWNKEIKNVTTRADQNNQIIAITLSGKKNNAKLSKEGETVFYLKESQENLSYILHDFNGGWRKKGSYMSLSTNPLAKINEMKKSGIKLRKLARDNKNEKTKDKVNEAIVQQQKMEKLPEKSQLEINDSLHKNNGAAKVIGEKIEKIFVVPKLNSQEIHQHIREALLHSKDGAVIVLHMEHTYKKPKKKVKIYIPEFKSRGFRLSRERLEL